MAYYDQYIKIKNDYIFKVIEHNIVEKWITQQNYLQNTIHESWNIWVDDHQKYKNPLRECNKLWSTVWIDDQLIGIYFSTMLNNTYLKLEPLNGLYDGFEVIHPDYRNKGFGLSSLSAMLDRYKLWWTYSEFTWDYNWTSAVTNLLKYNKFLGYDNVEIRNNAKAHLLWRFSNGNTYEFN